MGFNDQQNKRISNFIIDELRLNPISDDVPKRVNNSIQPTFEVNRKFADTVRETSRATTGTSTVFTTPTDRDFFLTGATMTASADATADNTSYALTSTIQGTSRIILGLRKITTTAYAGVISQSFDIPIKLDRGVTITVGSTFTVGSSVVGATIVGYTQETGDVTPA